MDKELSSQLYRIGRSILAHEIADIHDLIGLERHRNDATVRWIDPHCDVVAIMLRQEARQKSVVAERDMAVAGKVGRRLPCEIGRPFRALRWAKRVTPASSSGLMLSFCARLLPARKNMCGRAMNSGLNSRPFDSTERPTTCLL